MSFIGTCEDEGSHSYAYGNIGNGTMYYSIRSGSLERRR